MSVTSLIKLPVWQHHHRKFEESSVLADHSHFWLRLLPRENMNSWRRLRLFLPAECSVHKQASSDWPGWPRVAGPEAGRRWILSNRNDSCLVDQSPGPVGVGTNHKSSSDITDDITGEWKVFIAGALTRCCSLINYNSDWLRCLLLSNRSSHTWTWISCRWKKSSRWADARGDEPDRGRRGSQQKGRSGPRTVLWVRNCGCATGAGEGQSEHDQDKLTL